MRKPIYLAFLLLTGISLQAISQTTTVSPYSKFGLGDLQFKGYSENNAMGGTGISLAPAKNINVLNPASYCNLSLTTFEAGGSGLFLKTSNSSIAEKTKNSAFSYLALGFPVTPFWGTSIGIHPYSSVGYDVTSSENVDSVGQVKYNYVGSGNLNEVYWGNGFKLFKGLSVGLNASYIFGNIIRSKSAEITGNYYWRSNNVNTLGVGGFHFQGGLQYQKELKNEWSALLGITGSVSENVKAKSTDILELQKRDAGGNPYALDSAGNTSSTYGSIKLPADIGVGISLRNNKWMIAGEYSMQNWSKYSAFSSSDVLSNSNQFSLGLQLTPDDKAFAKYYKRVQYRIGFKYANTYIMLPGSGQVKEMLVSAGAGFPVSKSGTMINAAVEGGRRGALSQGQIQEDYLRITIGFNFNDKWFIKNRFD